MSWVAAGVAAGAIGGAVISSNSAEKASNTQAGATDRATAVNNSQYAITRSDQAPYRDLGQSALARLKNMQGFPGGAVDENDPRFREIYQPLLDNIDQQHIQKFGMSAFDPRADAAGTNAWVNIEKQKAKDEFNRRYGGQEQAAPGFGSLDKKFTVDDFWADPVTQVGYQYGKDLGEKTLKSMAPLTYGTDSGAAVKEATKFGQDYAGSKADASYARFEGDKSNVFNRLMAMIGGGQVSNQVTTGAGTNAANTNSALITAGGNAQGAAQIAQGNAMGGALGNISNWWQQNAMLDKLTKSRSAGGYSPSLYSWNSTGASPETVGGLGW